MVSMFSRLYSYRERADNAPLENFLTEALAEVFRRLPINLQISFALALVPPADRNALSDALTDVEKIELQTQVSIPVASATKRPDLVLYAAGQPLIVIEAKVGATLQNYVAIDGGQKPDQEHTTKHQLRTYAEWIVTGRVPGDVWPGAITFLTTYTVPPADFIEGRYRGAISSIRSWKDIGEWIVREVAITDRQTTHCALAAEFRQFLKERKLMTKYILARDLAAAALFAPSAVSLYTTFTDVMKALGRHAEKLKGSRQIKAEFWSEGNSFWGWFHFAKSVKRKASKPYVAVGICFEVAEPWSADVAKLPRNEPFFFVVCADDWVAEAPATYLTRVPIGWIEIDDGWMIATTRPVSQFSADPDIRVEELKAWAIGHVDELVACIPDYAVAPLEASTSDADDKAEA